jgi:hypothetical protein
VHTQSRAKSANVLVEEIVITQHEQMPPTTPEWSDSSSTYTGISLRELYERVMRSFTEFAIMADRMNAPDTLTLSLELAAYFERVLGSGTNTDARGSVALADTDLSGENEIFGLSPESIRRLWDNDADRYWDTA